MLKDRFTCRRFFKKYKSDELITSCRLSDERSIYTLSDTETVWYSPSEFSTTNTNYVIGPIINRLYDYEELGYAPEELRKIISEYKVFKAKESFNESLKDYNDALEKYVAHDVQSTREAFVLMGRRNGKNEYVKQMMNAVFGTSFINKFEIKKVIFNDPATIVFWGDGSKTVVKATNEEFDPEKGLAMAISKKALGNNRSYFEVFKKWIGRFNKEQAKKKKKFDPSEAVEFEFTVSDIDTSIFDLAAAEKMTFRVKTHKDDTK